MGQCQDVKSTQNRVFTPFFSIFRFLDYKKSENKFLKNIETTIIDVKFDEKFKSEFRFRLPRKEKSENCKKSSFWKIRENC